MKKDIIQYFSAGFVIITLALSGCTKDSDFRKASSSIGFSASIAPMWNEPETKSGLAEYELADESGQIVIPMTYEVLDAVVEQISTKGTMVNDNVDGDNIALPASYSPFYAYAYNGAGAAFFTSATGNLETISLTDSKWSAGHTYSWPEDAQLTFFAYANMPSSETASVECSKDGETLTYTSVPVSAADQKDILLGYYTGKGEKDNSAKTISADIVFQHPLTAVRFKLGDWERGAIKSVSIKGVAASGSVALSSEGTISTWTVSDYSKTVTTSSGADTGFSISKGDYIGDPFILIPQNMTDHPVTVKVTPVSGPALTAVLNTGSLAQGKVNVLTIGFDSHTYVFDVTSGTEMTFSNMGSAGMQIISLKSYRYEQADQSDAEPVSFKVEYSIDNGVSWSKFAPNNTTGDPTPANLYGMFATSNPGSVSISDKALYSKAKSYQNNTDFKYGWEDKGYLGSSSNYINLAQRDANGDVISGGGEYSANCYVIHQAGYYKLPLVYGNSLQGSSSDKGYSTSVSYLESGVDRLLRTFINCDGNPITSGNILTDLGLASSAVGAKLIWQDAWENGEGLITEVGIDGQYLTFKTTSGANLVEGNAVLAVYEKSSDKILWSWHIWVSSLDFSDAGCQSNPGSTTVFGPSLLGWCNGKAIKYYVDEQYHTVLLKLTQESGNAAPVILTVHQPDVASFTKGNCTYYNSGRKDPILGYDYETSSNKNWYTIDSDVAHDNVIFVRTQSDSRADNAAAANAAIAKEIRNPQTVYSEESLDSGNYHDFRDRFYVNLWSLNQNKATNTKSIPVVKTIYDPCPYGFKLPCFSQFSPLSTSSRTLVYIPHKAYQYGNIICNLMGSRLERLDYAGGNEAFSTIFSASINDVSKEFNCVVFDTSAGYASDNASWNTHTSDCDPIFPVKDM